MKASVSLFRIDAAGEHAVRIGAVIATASLLTAGAAVSALAAAPSSTFRFALPGGAAILYGNASNPHAPLPDRAWRQAVFYFSNGATFSLLPGAGKSKAGGVEMEARWLESVDKLISECTSCTIGKLDNRSASNRP